MGLLLRFLTHNRGLTILCCDNITGNGNMLRQLVGDFALAMAESKRKAESNLCVHTIAPDLPSGWPWSRARRRGVGLE